MLKKITNVMIILSIFTASSHSGNPWDPRLNLANPYDGAYVGANLGLDYSKNKVTSSHPSFYHKSHVSFNGEFGGLLLGYGKTTNDVYTGVELSFHLVSSQGGVTSHSVDNNAQNHFLRHTVKKDRDTAVSIRIGKLLENKFLVYTKFQGGIEDLTFSYFLDDSINHTNKKVGKKLPHIKLGVGCDWLVTEKAAIGMAYDYKIPKNVSSNVDNIKSDHTIDTSILSLRALYYF